MLKWINQLIQKHYLKKFKPKNYKVLIPWFHTLFKSHGEGVYLVNTKSTGNNFVSRAIAKFSNGYSHSFIFIYAEDLSSRFTPEQWIKLIDNWNHNYGGVIPLTNNIKTVVLASADSTGMECYDFSHFELRKMTIRKIPCTIFQEKIIINYLMNIVSRSYDYTGLLGWLFKIGDDRYSYYCSENVYCACHDAEIKIADNSEPSPGQIEKYLPTQAWKIFLSV